MKKAITLFLIAGICLSLCACAPKTQRIEITMDNWQEYFEFYLEDIWETDSTGKIKTLHCFGSFGLKEEYLDRAVPDESNWTLSYQYNSKYQEIEIDWDKKTYSLKGEAEYLNFISPAIGKRSGEYLYRMMFGATYFKYWRDPSLNPHGSRTVIEEFELLEISGYITLLESV